MRWWIALLTVALVACGGSGGGTDYSSPHALADKLDCTGYDEQSGAIAPADVATCQYKGEQVTLVVGSSTGERDATVTMAKSIADKFSSGDDIAAVIGGKWAVLSSSAVAHDVQAAVGGKITSP